LQDKLGHSFTEEVRKYLILYPSVKSQVMSEHRVAIIS